MAHAYRSVLQVHRPYHAWLIAPRNHSATPTCLKLGISALVKELQEIDIDGAPLLFHAASGFGERSCWRTAADLIQTVFGQGGLMEQIETVDGEGRNILMYAARSNDVDTFRRVYDIVTRAAKDLCLPEDANGGFSKVLKRVDNMGMSCLHHAADAGCQKVLEEVMQVIGKKRGLVSELLGKEDKKGRTPIMFVLRNSRGWGGKHPDTDHLVAPKFRMLYNKMAEVQGEETRWMSTRKLRPRTLASKKRNTKEKRDFEETRAVTELLHAARGGKVSLELALNHALSSSKVEQTNELRVEVDEALDVQERVSSSVDWRKSPDTKTLGRALLLAAAAKLGDEDVLYHVLVAIQVRVKRVGACGGEV